MRHFCSKLFACDTVMWRISIVCACMYVSIFKFFFPQTNLVWNAPHRVQPIHANIRLPLCIRGSFYAVWKPSSVPLHCLTADKTHNIFLFLLFFRIIYKKGLNITIEYKVRLGKVYVCINKFVSVYYLSNLPIVLLFLGTRKLYLNIILNK